MSGETSKLKPRPRPSWKTQLTSTQFGGIAEDLVALTLAAAAGGSGAVGRPFVDRGVDLYLRRLLTLLATPFQVKAFAHLEPDGTGTLDIPVHDLRDAQGYWVVVHVPPPHDQLYDRLYLIPVEEIRRRCPSVADHEAQSFRLTVDFTGVADDLWSDFAVSIDTLPLWIAKIPGWAGPIRPLPKAGIDDVFSTQEDIGTVGIAALSNAWAIEELERAANGAIMVAQDRTRLDTVTLLVHHLSSGRYAGLHVRTGFFDETRRTHFEVKRLHFFTDPNLWVLLLLRSRPDRLVHDFALLIPSEDIPELGLSETITLDPLTKRFRKYQIPSLDFGGIFLDKAFADRAHKAVSGARLYLKKAS